LNKLPADSSNKVYLEDTKIKEQEELIEMISQPSMKCGKIINKVELIRSLCATSKVSEEEDMLLNKKLDDIINMLNKTKKLYLNTVENVNIQKTITGQMRLYSTIKRKLHKNNIHKPTINETNAIHDGINSQNNEYVNIRQTFDYGYLWAMISMIECINIIVVFLFYKSHFKKIIRILRLLTQFL